MTQSFSVECPACHARGELADQQLLGKRIVCPACRQEFVVMPLEEKIASPVAPFVFTPSDAERSPIAVSGRSPRTPKSNVFMFLSGVTCTALITVVIVLIATRRGPVESVIEKERLPAPQAKKPVVENTVVAVVPSVSTAESELPTPTHSTQSIDEIASAAEKSVVLVETFDHQGNHLGIGTGFVVDDGRGVATNYHVVEGCTKAKLTFYDKQVVEGTHLRNWNYRSDLAIVDVSAASTKQTPLKLAVNLPDRGAEVLAIGHPRGLQYTTTNGIVSSIYRTDELPFQFRDFLKAPDDERWIQTTACIIGGNSGGPLLNSAGEVVGINSWTISEGKLGMAVQVDTLRTLLGQSRSPERFVAVTAPHREIKLMWADYDIRQNWFLDQLERIQTTAAREKFAIQRHPGPELVRRMQELLRLYPESPSAFAALEVIFRISNEENAPQSCQTAFEAAAQQLLDRFADDPRMRGLVQELGESSNHSAWTLLRNVSQKSTNKEIRALACMSLVNGLTFANTTGQYTDELVSLYERIHAEFPDVQIDGKALKEFAKDQPYLVQHLSIGCQAPNISGTDVDGKSFQLSDYRGKVVVLDFTFDQCPYCVEMYPQERELVTTHANDPFVMLGVSIDGSNRLRELINDNTITWRTWNDGDEGPICHLYRCNTFPNIFVLDPQGIIRYRMVRGKSLIDAVNSLLEESPPDATQPVNAR